MTDVLSALTPSIPPNPEALLAHGGDASHNTHQHKSPDAVAGSDDGSASLTDLLLAGESSSGMNGAGSKRKQWGGPLLSLSILMETRFVERLPSEHGDARDEETTSPSKGSEAAGDEASEGGAEGQESQMEGDMDTEAVSQDHPPVPPLQEDVLVFAPAADAFFSSMTEVQVAFVEQVKIVGRLLLNEKLKVKPLAAVVLEDLLVNFQGLPAACHYCVESGFF